MEIWIRVSKNDLGIVENPGKSGCHGVSRFGIATIKL